MPAHGMLQLPGTIAVQPPSAGMSWKPARQRQCLGREGSANTDSQCLGCEGGANMMQQRQCLGREGSANTRQRLAKPRRQCEQTAKAVLQPRGQCQHSTKAPCVLATKIVEPQCKGRQCLTQQRRQWKHNAQAGNVILSYEASGNTMQRQAMSYSATKLVETQCKGRQCHTQLRRQCKDNAKAVPHLEVHEDLDVVRRRRPLCRVAVYDDSTAVATMLT